MPVADRGQLFPGRKFISTVLEALDTKTEMSGEMTRRYLQRAAMALMAASASGCRPALQGVMVECPLAMPIIGLSKSAFS